MRRKNSRRIAIILMIIVMILTACGSKKDTSYSSPENQSEPMATEESSAFDTDEKSDAGASVGTTEEKEVKGESQNSSKVETNRKLIKRVQMDVETKDFEELLTSINSKVESLSGYMESSEVNGNTYYEKQGTRYARMIIRIPSTNLNNFVTTVKELGNVINSSESTEDITLQYVDAESHKNSLRVEQERLIEILKNAKKLEDIIKLEERLSKVRYEIESYQSQIRTFDNLVDYSTITLDINEVQHITPVEDKTVFQRMQSGLETTLFDMKIGAQNVAVWFVTNFPYLIIWAIIIAAIVIIIRKRLQKLGKFNTNITTPNIDKKLENNSNEKKKNDES